MTPKNEAQTRYVTELAELLKKHSLEVTTLAEKWNISPIDMFELVAEINTKMAREMRTDPLLNLLELLRRI